MSPPQTVVKGVRQLDVDDLGVTVKVPRSRPTGKQYEQAVGQQYVLPRGGLADELFPEFAVENAPLGQRRPSTLDTVRVTPQSALIKGRPGGGGRARIPDWRIDVFRRDPATQRRGAEASEVHAVEATLVAKWELGNEEGERKRIQSFITAATLLERYPTARVTYHIIAPESLPKVTKDYLENEVLKNLNLAFKNRLTIVWRVVPWRALERAGTP
jgi:hypothetical protein